MRKIPFFAVTKHSFVNITIEDCESSVFLSEDAKYVQASYRREYLKSYTEAFITRLKTLKEDKEEYKGQVSYNELKNAVELLNEQESQINEGIGFDPKFLEIYKISIYTTFILEESVHPLVLHFLVVEKNQRFFEPQIFLKIWRF